jgi:PAS domain S-box-containing protein
VTAQDASGSSPTAHDGSSAALEELVFALREHEEELHIQNEQLRDAERDLAASQRRYRALFQHSPVAKLSLDSAGRICEANDAASALLGHPAEALIDMTLGGFVDRRDLNGMLRLLAHRVDGQDSRRHPLRLKATAQGEHRVVILSQGGRADELSGERQVVLLDVTRERALAERVTERSRELRRAHRQLSSIVDSMADALVVVDHRGCIERVNRALCDLLGYTPGDLHGRRIGVLVREADDVSAPASGSPAPGGGDDVGEHAGAVRLEIVGRSRKVLVSIDGERIPVVLTGARVRDIETGELERVVCVAHDVREQLQREEQLRLMVEAAPVAMLVLDVDGLIVGANRSALSLFDYARDELLGRPALELLPDAEGGAGAERWLIGTAPIDVSSARAFTALRKNGDAIPVGLGVSVLDSPQQRRSLVTVLDLSERQRIDEVARHAQKMEAVGTLASGVAHDVNNLLMGIGGCARIALAEVAEGRSVRLLLNEIVRAVDDGAGISRQLVEFSRRGTVAIERLALDRLIERQRGLWERLVGESVRLRVDLDAPSVRLAAVPVQLEQVFMNLVLNARDAMPSGGELSIRTREVEMAEDEVPGLAAGRYARIEVRDTGVGIQPGDRDHIFEPFFTTKPLGRGTGLGLAMAYATMKRAGGWIGVESALGEGALFTLWVPVADHDADADERDEPAGTVKVARPGATVLLVEDEPAARLATKFYLERAGYRVLEAEGGAEAVRCSNRFKGHVDILLTDVVMPDRCGDEVAAAVTQRRPGVAVLFMSAHPRELLVERGRIPPNAHLLGKPFDDGELLRALHHVLASALV